MLTNDQMEAVVDRIEIVIMAQRSLYWSEHSRVDGTVAVRHGDTTWSAGSDYNNNWPFTKPDGAVKYWKNKWNRR